MRSPFTLPHHVALRPGGGASQQGEAPLSLCVCCVCVCCVCVLCLCCVCVCCVCVCVCVCVCECAHAAHTAPLHLNLDKCVPPLQVRAACTHSACTSPSLPRTHSSPSHPRSSGLGSVGRGSWQAAASLCVYKWSLCLCVPACTFVCCARADGQGQSCSPLSRGPRAYAE